MLLGRSAQFDRWAFAVIVLAALLVGFVPGTAVAQARGARALRSVRADEVRGGWDVEIQLDFAARYLRHVPDRSGMTVRIQIEPLDLGTIPRIAGPFREHLPLPRDSRAPIDEISFDQRTIDESYVEISFTERMNFDVNQGDDLRVLRLRLEPDRPKTALSVPTERLAVLAAESTQDEGGDANRTLSRAKVAIRDGEIDRAILLLSKLLEESTTPVPPRARRSARELLGLARERRGQLAHARGEYEKYLVEFPEGEGSDRVRQRLDALMTATSLPSPGLRKRRREASAPATTIADIPLELETFGSLGVRYFRTDEMLDDGDGAFLASDVLTDFDLANRVEAPDFSLRTDFTGTFDVDVSGSNRSNDLRVSRLSIEIEDKLHGLEATIGRQRRSDSGVLGRFDGLHVSARLDPKVSVSALVGLPVRSTSDEALRTETILGGGAIDVEDVGLEGLTGQLFVIAQETASMTDRAAIGGDLRYASDKTYSFIYFDYDFLFEELNTFVLSSTWYWTEDTSFRGLVERRSTPILELGTALQGQSEQDLDGLRTLLSENEIRDLALDRTQFIWTGSAGFTHRATDKVQYSGDVYVSQISSTEDVVDARTLAQIPGAEATGPDVSVSSQVLVNDWLIENGVGSASVRYFEGETSRAFSLSSYARFPVVEGLRASPRVRWEWRDSRVQAARSTLRPSVEFDYRWKSFQFEADFGIEWVKSLSGGDQDRATSYFVELGARWEF